MTAGTAAAPAPPSQASGQLPHRQILAILAGLMAGMFLAALDQTIVATSIRTIADDLQGLSLQAWVTTAYLITATITTPLYGKLSDIYGRKPFFLTAITIFIIGSLACGFATSMWQLAGFRALQGVGAGGLFSLALAIIGDIVPPRERARYQGYFLAVFGTSSVLGPVIGGFLAGTDEILGVTGWRWVFLVNVPIGIFALVLVQRVLNIPHNRRDHRIDWPGAIALVVGLVPLLVLAEQGREWGWGSALSLGLLVTGLVGLVAFVLVERRYGDEALLPLRLFRLRTFSIGSGLNLLLGVGMFGTLLVLPLYLQIVKGSTPTEAGLQLLPLTAGIMGGSIFAGQMISRTGRYKIFPVVGAAMLVVGMLLFSRVDADTVLWQSMVVMVLFGLGLGLNMQPLVLAIQNTVSPRDIGVATSSATFFRQMGGALGAAVFLSVLFSQAATSIESQLRTASSTPEFAEAAAALPSGSFDPATVLDDSSVLIGIDPVLARPFLVGFADAMQVVFLIGAVVLAIAFVLVLFLPEEPLRQASALQERLDADRADARAAADGTSVPPGTAPTGGDAGAGGANVAAGAGPAGVSAAAGGGDAAASGAQVGGNTRRADTAVVVTAPSSQAVDAPRVDPPRR